MPVLQDTGANSGSSSAETGICQSQAATACGGMGRRSSKKSKLEELMGRRQRKSGKLSEQMEERRKVMREGKTKRAVVKGE